MAENREYQAIAPKSGSVSDRSVNDRSRQNKRRKSSPVPAACQSQCRPLFESGLLTHLQIAVAGKPRCEPVEVSSRPPTNPRQCDALRPACNPCIAASMVCSYDLPAGLTPREAVKRNLRHLAAANENLRA